MANYGQHADCYPPGHSRGGPCGPNCPYYEIQPQPKPVNLKPGKGKHRGKVKD